MKFQAFHVNPGEKLKKKDVNNDLSNFMSVFPNIYLMYMYKFCHTSVNYFISTTTPPFNTFFPNVYITLTTY